MAELEATRIHVRVASGTYFNTSDRSYEATAFSFMCGTSTALIDGTKPMSAAPGMNCRTSVLSPLADTRRIFPFR